MRIKIEKVNPTKATEWLNRNHPKNRKLSKTTSMVYGLDMLDGTFHLTHQPIAFDVDGYLIDGQHRLAAVVESGCPQEFVVARGVAREVIKYTDRGRKRSTADRLYMEGADRHRSLMAGVARNILQLENGLRSSRKITEDRKMQCLDRYSRVIEWLTTEATLANYLRKTPYLAVVVWAHDLDPEGIRTMHEEVQTGVGLHGKSPSLHLRNFMLKAGPGGSGYQNDLIYRTCSAALATIDGRGVGLLRASRTFYDKLAKRVADMAPDDEAYADLFKGSARK